MRALVLLSASLLAACVGTENLEAEYCAASHGEVLCTFDDECCANHKCLPVPGLQMGRCFEAGRCIRTSRAGPLDAFPTGAACSCNDDCLSTICTNNRCAQP